MPVHRHHSNRSFPHLGEYLLALAMTPSSQGTVSPAIPGRFRCCRGRTPAEAREAKGLPSLQVCGRTDVPRMGQK
jgi:hypothetical protein